MSTPVTITVGDIVIPATLNDTVTAKALAESLPYTVSGYRSEFDYCCAEGNALPTDNSELQDGWKNGDLLYGGGWFAILFAGEEQSASHSDLMIVGSIDEGHLDKVGQLGSDITLTMEKA